MRKRTLLLATLAVAALLVGACGGSDDDTTTTNGDAPATTDASGDAAATGGSTEYVAEVWADNWFALYVDGELVAEDSVPITTERSFNAETITFTADPGFTLAVEAKDFTEDETGLEYIGTDRQQMGDGGIIVQVHEVAGGELVAASSSDWRALVINTAPTNPECASSANPQADCESDIVDAPDGWADPGFDDSSWAAATTWSEADVQPKDGYDEITWDPAAALVWSDDLETDNTVLLRTTVG